MDEALERQKWDARMVHKALRMNVRAHMYHAEMAHSGPMHFAVLHLSYNICRPLIPKLASPMLHYAISKVLSMPTLIVDRLSTVGCAC